MIPRLWTAWPDSRETAIASIGHIPLRAIRSSMTAIAISPGLLVDNVALLLADAERDDDLWTLAEYAASTELSLVAGSAGLARYIAPFWCWETTNADEEDEAWADRDGPVLVAVGTRNPMTQAQLAYLREADDVCVIDVMQGEEDAALPAIRRALDRDAGRRRGAHGPAGCRRHGCGCWMAWRASSSRRRWSAAMICAAS